MYSFRSLLAQLRRQPTTRRNTSTPRSFRPQLEALERRLVPIVSLGGAINGTVYADLTGNGLSPDDTPQPGVQVVLLAANKHHGYHEVAHALTGADGSYSFNNLTAGNYLVTERVPHDWLRTDPSPGRDYHVSLATGQVVPNQDFANFQLLHTAHVRDVSFTIFDPATGTTTTVHNLRGNTAQGDTVTANFWVRGEQPLDVSLVTYDAPGANAPASQLVLDGDATGTFTKGGPYALTIQIPNNFYQVDFVAGDAIDQFGPAGSNISYCAERRLISADSGGTQTASPATITGVVFTDNNNDGTFDAGDTPFAGAPVVLINTSTNAQQSTTTDGNGSYTFSGLPAGTYQITVTLPGGIEFFSTLTITSGSTTTDDFAAPPLS